ncbi:SprT-like domain-containing protein [Pinibacter aurantiacus]|uniref:SprT-like domain-containing protein n=1 Tax=Pinibacter aurantiacus TaxID=2851599 RepID=A0A9E2SAG9_9BACT|nr:SprT-like domain-containing protein [Pinibacter aurantiacus]MBV4356870.1 SprT-like domain-containing protein [Pinibacter aurantiacus]
MPKSEQPLHSLQAFIPQGSLEPVLQYIHQFKVHLTITRERKSVLGDYRHAVPGKNHRISVNGNLNQYAFLITLIHELAHLVTFLQFGNKVQSHGKEWKELYKQLLSQFLHKDIFPADVEKTLLKSLNNLPASSCADENLMRVLKKYDPVKEGMKLVEQVQEGENFTIEGGRVFKKGKQLRKRFQCIEIKTGKVYLFSPVYEVYA